MATATSVPTETALPPTHTPAPPTPTPLPLAYQPQSPAEKWIEVDLSDQKVTAWEGNQAVMHFTASTGLPNTPTRVGQYRIYQKYTTTRMIGPGYDLPNVPFTMYYDGGYALHGAYWHNNFGEPMSHGCVNLSPGESEALFQWAGPELPEGVYQVSASLNNPGTLVIVHD
jgi:lipoprotein-anchoring transpeptidase ErfK/SrfK